MNTDAKQVLTHARERFELQDYHGAIHCLEEVIESGRAFADAHHLLGLCYSLIGQPERALGQFDRALGLNPAYMEALLNRAIVLNDLGRTGDAETSFQVAQQLVGERRAGLPAHLASKLANLHAHLAEAFGIVVTSDSCARGPHPLHHAAEVGLRLTWLQAVFARPPDPPGESGGREERLGRHAARPQAVATQRCALDEGDPSAQGGSAGRGHEPRRAAAERDQIVGGSGHVPRTPRAGGGFQTGAVPRDVRPAIRR